MRVIHASNLIADGARQRKPGCSGISVRSSRLTERRLVHCNLVPHDKWHTRRRGISQVSQGFLPLLETAPSTQVPLAACIP